MPSPDSADAQAAYAIQSALVALRLDELRAALDAHERRRPLDRGHVAELLRVELRLAELVAFLRPETK